MVSPYVIVLQGSQVPLGRDLPVMKTLLAPLLWGDEQFFPSSLKSLAEVNELVNGVAFLYGL